MSVLSSTKSGKYSVLSPELLEKLGYERKFKFTPLYYRNGDIFSGELIKQVTMYDETAFCAYLLGDARNNIPYNYINVPNLSTLRELERYWDETDKAKKNVLRKQLVEKIW